MAELTNAALVALLKSLLREDMSAANYEWVNHALSQLRSGAVVLVPSEPTEEMYCAGDEALVMELNNPTFALNGRTPAQLVYRAMLDRAIKLPEMKGK